MGSSSKIEWTRGDDGTAGATWSPIRARYNEPQNDGSGKERLGWHCEHVSEGCRNCYAEAINRRLGTGRDFLPDELYKHKRYEGLHNSDVVIYLDEAMLMAPLKWKKPRRIFVESMSDMFGVFVTEEMQDRMFAVMALCSQHTFQVLTKRPERMRDYFGRTFDEQAWRDALIEGAAQNIFQAMTGENPDHWLAVHAPLPNVWLGTSVEDQRAADERIPHLLETPAALWFLSCEPLLDAVDISNFLHSAGRPSPLWVIVGGESGPKARPFDIAWAHILIEQCSPYGVPCFVKQLGSNPVTLGNSILLKDRKGGDIDEWPEALRVREFPDAP